MRQARSAAARGLKYCFWGAATPLHLIGVLLPLQHLSKASAVDVIRALSHCRPLLILEIHFWGPLFGLHYCVCEQQHAGP